MTARAAEAAGEMLQAEDGENGGRNTAGREQSRDAPIDPSVTGVDVGAARLGDGGLQQIRADGGRGVNAEEQHEQRRHQRPAADAGEADDDADGEAGKRLSGIDHPPTIGCRGRACREVTPLRLARKCMCS